MQLTAFLHFCAFVLAVTICSNSKRAEPLSDSVDLLQIQHKTTQRGPTRAKLEASVEDHFDQPRSALVNLPSGATVLGMRQNGLKVFLGIRYARAGRFEAPHLSVVPAGQVVRATAPGPECYQYSKSGGYEGEEDCNFLNIFTPSSPRSVKKAVMFYIHGGGFRKGSGLLECLDRGICRDTNKTVFQDLVQEGDVIVVSINYRLGVFGFFTADDADAPKNFGIRDQIVALQWVKLHIEHFGGDPHSVTIVGQSVGGLSVIAMYHSPMADGLFHRGIALSPGFQTPGLFQRPWKDAATSMSATCMKSSNCTTLECLRSKPAMQIAHTCNDFFDSEYLTKYATFAGVDGEVVPEPLWAATCQHKHVASNSKPLILGNAVHEWRKFAMHIDPKRIEDVFLTEYLQGYAGAESDVRKCACKKLHSLYANIEPGTCEQCNSLQDAGLLELASDMEFVLGAQLEAASSSGTRYRYIFDFGDDYSALGTTHSSDEVMISGNPGNSGLDSISQIPRSGPMLREYWTSFAKTGVPTSKAGARWESVHLGSGLLGLPLLYISANSTSMTNSAWFTNDTATVLSGIACKKLELESSDAGSSCDFKPYLVD